jgi:erythromycin esterase
MDVTHTSQATRSRPVLRLHTDIARAATLAVTLGAALAFALACGGGDIAHGTGPNGPPVITPPGTVDTAAAVLAWVNAHAMPLASLAPSVTPGGSDADLVSLGTMIGGATVAGFGEASSGTAEFQTLENRILQFLVTQKGFTGFALEADAPEALALDDYVRHRRGDPNTLLRGLYEWPWNTQEMIDLVQWIRNYNLPLPPEKQVGFYGFDMQSNAVAIDSVNAFAARMGLPSLQLFLLQQYAIVAPYRNDSSGQSQAYLNASFANHAQVHAAVTAAYDSLAAAAARITATLPDSQYQRALHMARLVEQWEHYYGSGTLNTTFRDSAMAENVVWLTQHLPAGTKLMVWAHNLHIGRFGTAMGTRLTDALGAKYVATGLDFGHGTFNARDTSNILRSHTADSPPANAIESVLTRARVPNYYVDLRTGIAGTPEYQYLHTLHLMRSPGAVYFDSNPLAFYVNGPAAIDYDILIYVDQSTPTTILPSVP